MTQTTPHTPTGARGRLTTHVLDTCSGKPAADMAVRLYVREAALAPAGTAAWRLLGSAVTNADGRLDAPLLSEQTFVEGRYRLEFDVGSYFKSQAGSLPEPAFLDVVPLDFGIADEQAHYHVPLLVSPWAYSTYRGS